jgi:hypothetical protein
VGRFSAFVGAESSCIVDVPASVSKCADFTPNEFRELTTRGLLTAVRKGSWVIAGKKS